MTNAQSFHSTIRAAQIWLMAEDLSRALRCLNMALGYANRLGRAVKRMVMRVICWVRAKVRGA